ncbi:MAG: BON domain-containing protein [Proteobacteria bacterium]|nr:BON domain-containing protein [Pseudomonadota bacterium]
MKAVPIMIFAAILASRAGPAQAIELNPFSAIKGAVEAIFEDRSGDDIAKDLEIKVKITAEVIDKMGTDAISIGVDVYEQDVMLSGVAENAKQKAEAEKLSRAVEGVKKLYNEILVIKAIDKKKGAVEGFVDDTVIESKINALLLDAGGVNVTNFRWRSVGGRVYLFGRALSKAELKKAIGIVRDIEGVAKVTSHVKVRPKS